MKPKILGLIGYPLTHSFSKQYFTEKFRKEGVTNYVYRNFELSDINFFPELLKTHPDIAGLNITIPYKEKILDFVDELSPEVAAIGATNTLVIHPVSKKITAYNTDIYGFKQSLLPCLKPEHRKALILGTGGAAKAVAYTLRQLNIDAVMVSRQPKNATQLSYTDLNEKIVKSHLLVVNTTPLGQFPEVEKRPAFPYNFITGKHLFYDLIYNPAKTTFLQIAENQGAIVCNGLNMLQLQAEKAWRIWTKQSAL